MEQRLIVVDAGPLYAYVDSDDQHHDRALSFFSGYEGTLHVPILVIPEVVHFISNRIGPRAEALFLADLSSEDFSIEMVEPTDWFRIPELVT